jgi:hypothetical protein
MKQKKLTILVSIMVFMMSALLPKAAFADCKYVSIDKGKAVVTSIPCDFPVQIATADPAADKENFEKALAEWRLQHPDLSGLDMTPGMVSGKLIQIPNEELINFSPEKREAIREKGSFYQIIQ